MSIDFLILYEHKVREFENICLIKVELERRGYSVIFSNTFDVKNLKLFFLKPEVLVGKAMETVWLYKQTIKKCGRVKKIVNLQWEQVINEDEEKQKIWTPSGKAKEATHICWGKKSYNRLKKAGVKNAVITGHIAMDFLRPEFKEYYKSKQEITREFNLDNNKKLVLFISSFGLNSDIIDEEMFKTMNLNYNYDWGKTLNEGDMSRSKILEWADRLLTERKDIVFVYRPHPSENYNKKSILDELAEKHSNFKVIREYSVKQWILVADRVLTWVSTSIVEAFFAKKHVGVLRPISLSKDTQNVEIYKDIKPITTYEKMLEEIDNPSEEFPIQESVIREHYLVDETPSYIKVCDLLEEVLKTSKYDLPGYSKSIIRDIYDFLQVLFVDTIISVFHLQKLCTRVPVKRLKNRFNNYFKNKHEFYSKEELKNVTDKLKKIIKKRDYEKR